MSKVYVTIGILISIFLLIGGSLVVLAVPTGGSCTPGTHWCENNGRRGYQEYVCNQDGKTWSGPYPCPKGCSGVGTGQNCVAVTSICGVEIGDDVTEISTGTIMCI